MALFQQFKSLFQLPGQWQRTSDAAVQAARVQNLLAQRNAARFKPTPPPQPSVAPSMPEGNPQYDAIRAKLGEILTSAQNLQKTAQAPTVAPTPAPQVDTLSPIQAKITTAQAPSPEEEQLRTKLSNLLASRDIGLTNAEAAPIPLQAILGEQGRIERRATAQAGTLQEQLSQAQARRQAALEGAKTEAEFEKTKYERAKPNEEKVDEYTNAEGKHVVVFHDKNTGGFREQVLGKELPKVLPPADRMRALQTASISVARPILIGAKEANGYVNPNTYLKVRNDFAEAIGDPTNFDRVFGPMLSPAERERLGVGRVITTAEDIGSVLARYLGGQ